MSPRFHKIKKAVLLLAVVPSLVALGQNCSRFESSPLASVSDNSTLSTSQDAPLPIALLSSEQLLKSMIASTGTEGLGELDNPADDLIRQVYADRSGALPSGQDLKLVSGPTMISVTNLASAVCAKAVDRDRALGESQRADRLFFREFDFSKGAEMQSRQGIENAVQRLALNSWRRAAGNDELSAFSDFAAEFTSQATTGDIQGTRLLAISVCTGVLSSFDAITY